MTAPETTYKAGQLAEISWALNEACASHGHREMAEWRPVVGGKRPGWWLTKSGMSIPDHAASDVVLMKTMPEDFRSDTLTDLERARTVAVELEQENAVLRQRIDKAQADHRQYLPAAVDFYCCEACNRASSGYVPYPCPVRLALSGGAS